MRSAIAAVPSIGRAAHVERAARDADATHDLYERYSGQIYGFCVNKLGSRDEAEDALQSTFLNAHRALRRGVTPEAELAWLFKIAHNVCLTRRRSSWRRGRVETPSDFTAVQDIVPAPSQESPDDLMRLTEALEHMPDNQRRAILLREWQGLSYHEIADELELSQSAVETLIFRARRTLASNLESEPAQPSKLARMRKGLDAGALLAALKGLFEGGAAVKVAAVAVAASGTVVVVAAAPTDQLTKPDPQKQAAAVTQAAPPPVVFERARPQPTVAPQVKLVARRAPTPEAARVVEAPASAQPAPAVSAQQKPKAKPKATPPGQAKKHVPVVAKSHGNAGKEKRKKVKGKASVDSQAAPAPSQLVAPVEPPAANGNGQPDDAEKSKGPKK